MADNKFTDLGKQIGDSVQAALQSGDFSQLKQTVQSTVQTAVDTTVTIGTQIGQKVQQSSASYRPVQRPVQRPASPPYARPAYVPRAAAQRPVRNKLPYQRRIAHYRTQGALLACFGTLIGLFFLLVFLARLVEGHFLVGLKNIVIDSLLLVLLGGSVVFLCVGIARLTFAKRYAGYWKLIRGAKYCELDMLAQAVGKPSAFTVKEISRLLDEQLVPGHLDDEKTCLIISEDAYRHYLEAKESLRQRQAEEEAIRQDPNGTAAVLAEGRKRVRQIHELNDLLPGELISAKLDRLEAVTAKIFEVVEQRPGKLPEIRRFMDYYLPTTIKIVTAYHEFEENPKQGDNIQSAKQEIEEILDTINAAFETLLDGLYEEETLDISTDISALRTMLAREGLAGSDFKKTPEQPQ